MPSDVAVVWWILQNHSEIRRCVCAATDRCSRRAPYVTWRLQCMREMRRSKPVRLQSKQNYCGCNKSVTVRVCVCVTVLHSLRNQMSSWAERDQNSPNNFLLLLTECVQSMNVRLPFYVSGHNPVVKRPPRLRCSLQTGIYLLTSRPVPSGGELLAGAGDEWRAHRASIPALLPAGLGTSCDGHHCPGHRLAWRLWMDNTQCVRSGSRRRVSATAQHNTMLQQNVTTKYNKMLHNAFFKLSCPTRVVFQILGHYEMKIPPFRRVTVIELVWLRCGDFSFCFGLSWISPQATVEQTKNTWASDIMSGGRSSNQLNDSRRLLTRRLESLP